MTSDSKSSSVGVDRFREDLCKLNMNHTMNPNNDSRKLNKPSNRYNDEASEEGSDIKYRDQYDKDRDSVRSRRTESVDEQHHDNDNDKDEIRISEKLLQCGKLLSTFNPSATAEMDGVDLKEDPEWEQEGQQQHQDRAQSSCKKGKIDTPKFQESSCERVPLEELSYHTCNNFSNTTDFRGSESFLTAKSSNKKGKTMKSDKLEKKSPYRPGNSKKVDHLVSKYMKNIR